MRARGAALAWPLLVHLFTYFTLSMLQHRCWSSFHQHRPSYCLTQSHNGMEIYTDDKDFVTAQLVSTRNIHPGLFMDWFCGGLNYQIE